MSTEATPSTQPGRIAAIDYGTVRIGIAISDRERRIASPYENYARGGEQADARRFARLVAEEDVKLFVVGLPVHLSGGESQKSREARRFGEWLSGTTGVCVEYFDERYTSAHAEELLLGVDMSRKQRKQRRDMLAAQILLAAFLEAGCRSNDSPGSFSDD